MRLGVLRCSNILAGGGSYDIHTYEKYSTSREIMYVYYYAASASRFLYTSNVFRFSLFRPLYPVRSGRERDQQNRYFLLYALCATVLYN